MGPETYFLVLFMKVFLKEHRLCCFEEGGISFFGISQNILNKKLSVFPHSWSPIIVIQIEKLEAERREILWFKPSSCTHSWCGQNVSRFCEVWDTEYLRLPQQYLEIYVKLSAQIPEGGIGRPIP